MTTTVARIFLDTNVLVRARFSQYPEHSAAQQLLNILVEQDVELWISRQVIREFIATVSRPQLGIPSAAIDVIAKHIPILHAIFHVADETLAVTEKLVDLLQRFPSGGKQVQDANLVATMLVHGINTMVTLNTEDLRRFSPLITLMPLQPEA